MAEFSDYLLQLTMEHVHVYEKLCTEVMSEYDDVQDSAAKFANNFHRLRVTIRTS